MIDLPKTYQKYLEDLAPDNREALTPSFQQSVAEGLNGVLVTFTPHDTKAQVSEEVPYGEVREQRL